MLSGIFVILKRHLLLGLGFFLLPGQRTSADQSFFAGIRMFLHKFLAEQGVAQKIKAEIEQDLVIGDQRCHDLDRGYRRLH